ncbi:MAG: restriction endonuclease subunit S [Oceanisphaera sp.]|uniref:restriction endonuclease subunit S n=1 Tax=Oceanisphaera sp. TaxID=1929979 RepID=UPI003C7292AD
MSKEQLLHGWVPAQLGDLGDVITGKTPSTKEPGNFGGDIPFVKPGDLDRGKYIIKTADTLSEAGFNLIPKLPEKAIMVTCIGNLGKVGITTRPSSTNQQINSVIPLEGVNYKYLYHYLSSMRWWLEQEASATTVAIINKGKFSKAPVLLPPLAEQQEIAARLDTLLAQVDTLKGRLDALPAILKRFRQSVLAAAVSGKLTEEWREIKTLSVDNWEHLTFKDVCTEITVGFVGKMADRYQAEGIPFLRSQNVREFHFSPKNILYISESFHKEIFKSRLLAGDLAIVRSGAPGTTCVIPGSLGVANCSDLVIARPSKRLNSEFGCIYMNSEVAKQNVATNQVGVAQQHFNVGSMKKMPIHLPSIEEQTEIVRRVEQLFAFADQVEQRVKDAQSRVNYLTQSILAKAFRGELTADWRKQHPELISGEHSASALLARIQAERAAQAPAKRTRRKKASA